MQQVRFVFSVSFMTLLGKTRITEEEHERWKTSHKEDIDYPATSGGKEGAAAACVEQVPGTQHVIYKLRLCR